MGDPYRIYIPPLVIPHVDINTYERHSRTYGSSVESLTLKREKTQVWVLPNTRFEPYRVYPFLEGPNKEERKEQIPQYLKFPEVIQLIRTRNTFLEDSQIVYCYERIANYLEEVVMGKRKIRWIFEGV